MGKQAQQEYILFIDSGIGGVSILQAFWQKQKGFPIIYYADAEHFPYGNQDAQMIAQYLLDIYRFISSRYSVSAVVIACNTASVSAIERFRESPEVGVSVIGTVPAIKVAAEVTENGNIGVIATETTVKQNYLKDLAERFASDKRVYIQGMPLLATAIEEDLESEAMSAILNRELAFFDDKNIDSLVIGCTHYTFAESYINAYFHGRVKIVDSREGVTKRILSLLSPKGREIDLKEKESLENKLFVSSAAKLCCYREWNKKWELFGEIYGKDDEWKRG